MSRAFYIGEEVLVDTAHPEGKPDRGRIVGGPDANGIYEVDTGGPCSIRAAAEEMAALVEYQGVPYAVGERVELVAWAPSEMVDDNESVPPGTLGTVVGGGAFQLWVEWDNGSRLIPSGDGDRVRRVA